MDKEMIDLQVNNCICEAVQCFAKATAKIDVKVGETGVIQLYLCNHCVGKFDRKADTLDIAGKTTVLSLSSEE
jgi:hypothetical protein